MWGGLVSKCPPKVACFTWLVCKRACLTHEALQKRGWQICSRCALCEHDADVNAHLFMHCKAAMSLWNMFLCLLGVNWVMLKTTLELLSRWEDIGNRGRKEHWWRTTTPASVWWTLWKERNSRCFYGHNSNLKKIRTNCISFLHFWCKKETRSGARRFSWFNRKLVKILSWV